MLFDHLQQTEEELIGHVKAACAALAFLREVDPDEALKSGPVKEQWHKHMHALNNTHKIPSYCQTTAIAFCRNSKHNLPIRARPGRRPCCVSRVASHR